jgi:DNA-directed RNA polymerase sigma subunit (sigma70/sigma32)
MYILEASKVEPLTKVEEAKLFREMGHWGKWDEQGENAARRLVESQLMLVVSRAQKHSTAGVPDAGDNARGQYRSDDRRENFRRKARWRF